MANTHSLDLETSSSQFASRADTASLSVTGDMTIEAWVKRESTGAMCMVAKNNGTNFSYFFQFHSTDKARFSVSSTGGAFSVFPPSTTSVTADGLWHHVAVSYNAAAGTCAFYLDGATDGTGSGLPTSINDNASDFFVGQTGDSGDRQYFDGLIDEVRIWSDIRTAQEISDNYRTELVGNEGNLVAYYKFNNAYTDTTSNANDLTASGSPVFSTDIPFDVVVQIGDFAYFL